MSIKQLFFTALFFISLESYGQLDSFSANPFTVVLDPGIQTTTQEAVICLQLLQEALQDTLPRTRILLSRTSLEIIDPLRIASFSNRVNADLFISFNFFIKKEIPQTLRIYNCSSTASKPAPTNHTALKFIPACKVYEQQMEASSKLADIFFKITKKNSDSIVIYQPTPLPLKPLQPVEAPSFLLELTMSNSKEWKAFFPDLFEGIKQVITTALENKNECE